MAAKSSIILKVIHVLSWILFIGICINAGTILFSYFVSMYANPAGAKNLLLGLDLGQLKNVGDIPYSLMVLAIAAIFIFEAFLFYSVLQILKKINLVSPFHETIGKLIQKMSKYAFVIGLLSKLANHFAKGYNSEGMVLPKLNEHIGHGDAFLFFAGILYFISILFEKGIELQKENELTV